MYINEGYLRKTPKELQESLDRFYNDLKSDTLNLSERNIRMVWNNIAMIKAVLHGHTERSEGVRK